MSKAPPQKKLKQTSIQSAFQQTSKKKSARDSEPGETSQASDNVQETMDHTIKTEAEEGPSNLQQGAEEQQYNFFFSSDFNPGPVFVSGNIFMTVLDALKTRDTFNLNKNVNDVKKEIVILRADGAAVKKDFPCCLIEKDENLKIVFINKGKNAFTVKEKQERLLPPRTGLVTFYIETTGKKKMKYIMKNNELTEQADYVCVYAFRGEVVETALERDGRFIDTIFQKLCLLTLESREGANENGISKSYEMSNRVEHLNKKTFQIIAVRDKRPDIQKKPIKVKTESDVASAADSAQNDPGQHPIGTEQISGNSGKSGIEEFVNANTEQEETQKIERVKSTKTSAKYYEINNSEEIWEILCSQFDILLKLLMRREKLKKNSVFQKFFRAEYDKSVQSFSEVYKIKQLMKLSDSVCQIRVEGFARGTGFLLFGRFVLTTAHVVKDFLESPDKLSSTKYLEAAFDFERLDSKVKLVPVKKQLAAYCFITDANKYRLDFALLELDDVDKITGRPELLSQYNRGSPPNRGGICIVGHPDGGIKKADPCFIVENLQEAADKHISKNDKFIHVMTQKSFEDKWDVYENQINYNSCFFYRSSGSPVFDEDCYLIGVHTGGYMYPGEKGKTRSIVEYAYSIQPILDMIRAQAKIKGLHEVVNTLEAYSNTSNESGTAEQVNQTDWEMEDYD